MSMNPGLYSSGSYEWTTPAYIFEPLDGLFHFNLDPCASDRNHRCERYFTIADDGLAQPWTTEQGDPASVFMNPPYGTSIGAWAAKAVLEWRRGALVVALLPARTDTQWFQDSVFLADAILFLKGRIRFEHPCHVCGEITPWLYGLHAPKSKFPAGSVPAFCERCAASPPPLCYLTSRRQSTAPFPSCVAMYFDVEPDLHYSAQQLAHLGSLTVCKQSGPATPLLL